MQGKEKIIDDILSAARKTAAAMIDEATAERDAAVDALRAELEKSAAQAAEKICPEAARPWPFPGAMYASTIWRFRRTCGARALVPGS